MSNLTLRIITAVILAAAVLTVVFAFPGQPTLIFFTAMLLIGAWEWAGFCGCGIVQRCAYAAVAIGIGAAALAAGGETGRLLLLAAPGWWLLTALVLWRLPIRYNPVLVALAGYVVLLLAWLALLALFSRASGPWLFVWLALIVAAADIGAYFTGKAFGRRKLAPELSPGKTLEGLAGGLLAATALAVAGSQVAGVPLWPALLWGPLLAAVSVVGDLTVSAFKRNAGLKDTGRILPGHGGIMDRVDSLVAAAPFFVVILSFLGL